MSGRASDKTKLPAGMLLIANRPLPAVGESFTFTLISSGMVECRSLSHGFSMAAVKERVCTWEGAGHDLDAKSRD